MGTLDDKVALVTGASGGLGRAAARIFAREGARVVVVDSQRKDGEETVRLIRDAGGEAMFVAADVTCSSDVRAMVRTAVDAYGGLDCALNSVRVDVDPQTLADTPAGDWHRAITLKLTPALLCMKYEIPEMLKRSGGVIVNLGCERGTDPVMAFYISAKLGLTKVATLDYDSRGNQVSAHVSEGLWAAGMRPTQDLKSITPIGRFAAPAGVAEAAVWLCTNVASFVFGHRLADGGVAIN